MTDLIGIMVVLIGFMMLKINDILPILVIYPNRHIHPEFLYIGVKFIDHLDYEQHGLSNN